MPNVRQEQVPNSSFGAVETALNLYSRERKKENLKRQENTLKDKDVQDSNHIDSMMNRS